MKHNTMRRAACAAGLAFACAAGAFAEDFEGFSFSAAVKPVWVYNQFDYLETDSYAEADPTETVEYDFDHLNAAALMGELCLSWNWSRYYLGVSGFALSGLEATGTYDYAITTATYANYHTSDDYPLRLRQDMLGAAFEIGFCRGTTNFYGGGSQDGDARFHWGFGVGPYLRRSESNVPELAGVDTNLFGLMRFQLLLGESWGVEGSAHVVYRDGAEQMSMVGLGGFLKLP